MNTQAERRGEIKRLIEAIAGAGDIPRFDEALTHPSFANEFDCADNQRLEFLGDAVLGLCVSEMLTRAHPHADEGALTRMRSALVSADALAEWGRKSKLGEALSLGRGARAGTERDQTNVLADAVEALVAAVYEAKGLDGARAFVDVVVGGRMPHIELLGGLDPKSALQQKLQAEGLSAPTYRLVETRGPHHDQVFVVEAVLGERVLGRGEGRSKRAAERSAAMNALTVNGSGASEATESEEAPLVEDG